MGATRARIGCANQKAPVRGRFDIWRTNSTTSAPAEKKQSTKIFADAKLTLHKWNSNAVELERENEPGDSQDQSFAKQQLGRTMKVTKLLGLPWDKVADTLSVCFPQ